MKSIFKMLKPWIKSIIVAQMKSNEDRIVTLILGKIGGKVPLSGEQLEQATTVLYDTLEAVIIAEIDKI